LDKPNMGVSLRWRFGSGWREPSPLRSWPCGFHPWRCC